ncbi:MAG: hypothetical protein ACYDGR_07695 [Candidatus Dormibacteria bacterium]
MLLIGILAWCPLASGVTRAAAAISTVSGTLSFAGVVTLDPYPSNSLSGGVFNGSGSAVLGGVSNAGTPYAVSWTLGAMSATFLYKEFCSTSLPVQPATGSATGGTFTLTGGHFVTGGNGDPATFTGPFEWTRYGTIGLVSVIGGVTVSGSGGVVAVNSVGVGESLATFVPLPTPLPGNCQTTGTMSALVIGPEFQID